MSDKHATTPARPSGPQLAQRVGPDQVGQRVVLRRRLADGSAGDLLGVLVRWDTDDTRGVNGPTARMATVRTRAGDVSVAVDDVLGGKPVPPAPARRGRVHRTIDWTTLEDVASDGWRPLEQQLLVAGTGLGWRLRAAEGFTGRANSALALGDPGLPLADAVDAVERWYEQRGLPARVAVPWPLSARRLMRDGVMVGIDTDLDHELASRGYQLDTPTLVLTAATREVAVAATSVGGDDGVRLDDEPDDAWLAVYHYRGQQLPPVARTLLLSAPRQVFASVRDAEGRAAAVARGASSRGWTGITAMEVEPSHRRQGSARRLVGRLATWALEHGDDAMYLQVAESSSPARALYDSVGFAPHHGYHYRLLARRPSP